MAPVYRTRSAHGYRHLPVSSVPQLVIFDCDGVLVDSEAISNRVLADMLTAEGLATTLAAAQRDYQGMLLADVVALVEKKLGRALGDDWLATFERARAEAFRRDLRPVEGAADAVQRVLSAGIHVSVASQGKLSKTRLSLALTGLDRFFPETARFSAQSVSNGKPAPDLFLHVAATMGATPASSAVVEDTPSGVRAAVCAGMRALGFAADSDEHALRRAGAEIMRSMDELPALLGLEAANPRTDDEPVRIVRYDSSWPARFEAERDLLERSLGARVTGGVHHVGSTAVPGLAAKPVVDILVGVRDLASSRDCFGELAKIGYQYAPYRGEEMHWFCKPDPAHRTHHLHLVPTGSPRFRDELAFRDYLRDHADIAREYGALKRRLAERFEHDREAYTAAKADFIRAALDRARE
jgi:HAD superfamily hydrolase (TIGR01509 family)